VTCSAPPESIDLNNPRPSHPRHRLQTSTA
jgi:hypothetical protein